ncbi:unnamed protein product [Owenia fusiformis]|uniref:Uncharacterized protein n=1 Tax=Owenia fusiformis TaxID=6347 RepID=A0A8J1XZY1_OWEFU|nr:unnamed protein product [Owenia fusiformis]
MSFLRQLKLLLWKNFTLRRRQPGRIVIEIAWPLTLFIILAWVKSRGLQEMRHECHFDGKAMPSAGLAPFLQGIICTTNNTCHKKETDGEFAGQIQDFNTSLFFKLFRDSEVLFNNQSMEDELLRLIDDIKVLQILGEVTINGTLQGGFTVGSILVDPNVLRDQVISQNISLTPTIVNDILNASLNPIGLLNIATNMSNPLGSLNRELVCNTSWLENILVFSDPTTLNNVSQALCNLTMDEMNQLQADFVQDFDIVKTLTEVRNLTCNNAGECVNFDEETFELFRRFSQDVSNQDSFNALFVEGARLLADIQMLQNSSNADEELSMLVCGRREGALFPASSLFGALTNGTSGAMPDFSSYQQGAFERRRKKRDTDDSDTYQRDNTTTDYCNDLEASLKDNAATRVLWNQVKPLIRGKVPFTPNTPAVQKIVKMANGTFEDIGRIRTLAEAWLENEPAIYNFLDTNPAVRGAYIIMNTRCQAGETWACVWARFLYNGPKAPGSYDWRDSIKSVTDILNMTKSLVECFEVEKFVGYDNETELVKASWKLISENKFWAAIEFDADQFGDDGETIPQHLNYKIRMETKRVDSTKSLMDSFWKPGSRRSPLTDMKYVAYGFVYLQDMLDHGYAQELNKMEEKVGVYLQQFPYPCYIYDTFTRAISRSLPLFMVLAWIYSVSMIVKGIVYEKEKRLKEVMKMMGLTNGIHWLAWFITCFIMMFITVILLVVVLSVGKVLAHSDPSVLLVFMICFTTATIMQCFLISVLFSRANLAAACGAIIYFVLYLPYTIMLRWEEDLTVTAKNLAGLSSTVAFSWGTNYLSRYEEQGVGAQWSNIWKSPIPSDNYNLVMCMLMLLIDSVVYMVLAWYIEAVFPGEFGVPKPFYFPFTKSYWCGHSYRAEDREANNTYNVDHTFEMNDNQRGSEEFEAEPRDKKLGVAIKGLKKVYSRGKKLAVNQLSINFYEDHITSFLGHNGAGKTTTMSILTGLFPPTEGTAYIYDKDIRLDMDEIRQSLGMCPQYNVLFDCLTVEEHLWFYASLKGMDTKTIQPELEKMVVDIGLPHKVKEESKNLSGGMKRKLSVGIAFVGGSKTVILDEPTAGVDPYARRQIWELLLKYRKGRTILLSTHFMDEADILGDRIAIISQGKLKCCGSSLFLKSRYGSGYYLTMVKGVQPAYNTGPETEKKPDTDEAIRPGSSLSAATIKEIHAELDGASEVDEGVADVDKSDTASSRDTPPASETNEVLTPCDDDKVTEFVERYIPDAVLVENIGTELCYQLSSDGASDGSFERLFRGLDKNMADLGVSTYGVSDTTLEEVFLKVADESENGELTDETRRSTLDIMTEGGRYPRPISRLSFRSKCRSFFGKNGKIDSKGLLSSNPYLDDSVSIGGQSVDRASTSVDIGSEVENCNGTGSYKISGFPLIRRQFVALFIKRFHHVRKSRKGFVSEILLPAGFVCLALLIASIIPPYEQDPPLELHPWQYSNVKGKQDQQLFTFYSNDAPDNKYAARFEELMHTGPGPGTRCMNSSIYEISGFPCQNQYANSKWSPIPEYNANMTSDCDCSTGRQECPAGAEGPEPPYKTLQTTDFLYNMTMRNISDWIRKTRWDDQYFQKRYGGFSFGEVNQDVNVNVTGVNNLLQRIYKEFNDRDIPGLQFNVSQNITEDFENLLNDLYTRNNAKVWFNNKGWASMPIYMNVMNNMILRANLPASEDPHNYGITTYSFPVNLTKSQLDDKLLDSSVIDVLIAICVIFALSFIPASFVIYLIEERTSNSKHLQFVSGVNPVIYWLSNFAWDMLNYAIPAILVILIFLAFNQKAYVSAANFPVLLLLLFLYGWSIVPMMYPACYVFEVPSSAFVGLSCINVFLGFTSTIATFTLQLFNDDELTNINNILMQVFLVLPHYCLGRGLFDLTRNQLQSDILAQYGESSFTDPFKWDLVGRNLCCMAIQGVVFFAFNLLLQYRFFCSPRFIKPRETNLDDEDEDVARERQRVITGGANDDMLRIEELTKVYRTRKGKHTAVDGVCVGIPRGECFGLLGVNGAGKTTMFKMLTGDVPVTKGDAYLDKHSILTEMTSVHQSLGYCPQFDALDPLLTGEEHLQFYARLRGVPEKEVTTVAKWCIQKLGLSAYANKCSEDYSGGNKRKLSTAISLVGNPPVVFLDEPTTGMDPKARRFLWNCISNNIKQGRSVILTSHSMEECEALCGRIAIMVNGKFQCLGSVQHLKNRFGEGYTIILRVSGSNPILTPLIKRLEQHFPDALLKEKHHNMLQYQLGEKGDSLANIFSTMENLRVEFNIEDYSVSQTTLDQVFINFAKKQSDLLDDELAAQAAVGGESESQSNQNKSDLTSGVHYDNVQETDHEPSLYGSQVDLLPGNSHANPANQQTLSFA